MTLNLNFIKMKKNLDSINYNTENLIISLEKNNIKTFLKIF